MYNSEATLHDWDGITAGPRAVRRFLAAAPLVAVSPSVIEEEAGGQTVRIEWPGEPTPKIRLCIEHGQIAEQWLG